MKETMMTYINEQESICNDILNKYIENNIDFERIVKEKGNKKWLIIATGSSLNAVLSSKYYIQKISGITIDIIEPFTFINYEELDKDIDMVLAISQSGKSASTIEALKKVHYNYENITTVSVTSDINSKITEYSDVIIDIGCGIEKVGFVTKGFTSTVLTLMLMGISAAKGLNKLSASEEKKEIREFNNLINKMPLIIEKTEYFYNKYKNELNKIPRFSIIGYGSTFGVAKEAETKFAETVRVPTQGFELEAFMHGPYLEVDNNYGIFFIYSENNHSQRAEKLKKYFSDYTNYCYEISTKVNQYGKYISLDMNIDEYKSPLLLVIVFQVLSYRISEGRGIDLSKKIFEDFDNVLKSKI